MLFIFFILLCWMVALFHLREHRRFIAGLRTLYDGWPPQDDRQTICWPLTGGKRVKPEGRYISAARSTFAPAMT